MAADDLPVPPRLRKARPRATHMTKPPLNAEAIARAALELIEEEGYDNLNMRKLAQRLGTGPASLYTHVENREALLDLVFDLLVGEMEIPDPEPGRWQEQLKDVMRAQHDVYLRHRDVAKIALARVPTGERGLVGIERLLAVLRAAGLPDVVVGYAPDLVALYVAAVSLEQSLWEPDMTEQEVVAFTEQMRDYFASLPADRFPNLVAMAGPLTGSASGDLGALVPPDRGWDDRFEFGMDVIVRGLASFAADVDGAKGAEG